MGTRAEGKFEIGFSFGLVQNSSSPYPHICSAYSSPPPKEGENYPPIYTVMSAYLRYLRKRYGRAIFFLPPLFTRARGKQQAGDPLAQHKRKEKKAAHTHTNTHKHTHMYTHKKRDGSVTRLWFSK